MKGADRLQQGKSSLELIEEAVHLLRTAPASTLAYYYVGALPFVLGALYFWADMSRSAEAYQHLETASLSMALLFAWMKFWQAVFGHSLRTLMLGHSPAPWSFRRGWRLFLTQTALQPTGLLALPLAFLLLVPFGWVYAFYQNLTVLADNETTELRAVAKAAGRQATLWSRQNHLLLAILFGFGGCVLVNWSTVCYLLPGLVKTLFGLDSTFSRSGHSLLNSTFFAAMFGLTYLCADPILKASYALRCFYGQSLQSGEDLKAELKPFGAPSRVAAGIVFALFVTAMGLEAGETRYPKSEIRNNSEAFNFNIEGSKSPCACLESILVGFGRPTAASARQPYRDKFLTGPVPEAPLRIAQCFNIGIRVPKESFRSEGTGEPSAPHSGLPFGTWMAKGDASPSVGNAGLFSDVPPGQRDSDKSSVEHSQLSSSKLDRTIQEVLQQRKYTWRMPREKRVEPEQAEKGVIGRFLEKIGKLLRKWLKALGSWLEEWLRKLFQRQQTQSPPTSSGYGWILSQQLLLYLLVTAVVVGLGLLIYRVWRERYRETKPLVTEAIRPAPDLTDESVGADQLPEEGWMKLARELLEQGELRLALRAFYLASLAHLAERNLIRLAKFKSNRDYEQELRRRAHSFPELLRLFAENVSVFDRIWYGLHALSPELVEHFAANVERLKAGGGGPQP